MSLSAPKKGCETHQIWRTFNRRLKRKYKEGKRIKLRCPSFLHLTPALTKVRGSITCLKGGKWSIYHVAICIGM
jgi:hypothetical protein